MRLQVFGAVLVGANATPGRDAADTNIGFLVIALQVRDYIEPGVDAGCANCGGRVMRGVLRRYILAVLGVTVMLWC